MTTENALFDAPNLWAPKELLERTLSELPRKMLRNAIVSHPGWKAFSELNNCTVSHMTKRGFLVTAYTLGIDVPRVFENAEKQAAATEARMNEGRDFGERANSENGRDWEGAATVAPPVPVAAPVAAAPAPTGLGEMLAAVVEPHLKLNNAALKADVMAFVAEALKVVQPVTRLEVKRIDGTEWKSTGRQHPKFADLCTMLSMKQASGAPLHVWMGGPAGSGKTTAARKAAEALGKPFYFQGFALQTHDLLGFVSQIDGKYYPTPFRQAFENGGIVLLDEIDSTAWGHEAVQSANAALANGHCTFPDKEVKAHPDFVVIATGNTWGNGATAQYIGRQKIDFATTDRFAMLEWPSDNEMEAEICGNPEWARHVQKVRKAAEHHGCKDVHAGVRASMMGAAMIAAGWSWEKAAEHTYLAGQSEDTKRKLDIKTMA